VSARRLGIIMHGVTGRMGMNQHLIRSVLAIREQGGVGPAIWRRALGHRSRQGAAESG
jgi:hypothetical protein